MLFLLVSTLPGAAVAQPSAAVRLVTDTADVYFGALCMTGAATDSAFQVYTERPADGMPPTLPAMLGTYRREANDLYFLPRFPFIHGRTYWVLVNRPGMPEVIAVAIPEMTHRRPPQLLALYPSGELWPANQLKLYLQFDQPMRAGVAHDYLHLLTAEGDTVAGPFAELAAELWDARQQRLTVWFDPGRIKSGLLPNQRLGPPLLPDRTYRLVISKDWPAANGLPLGQDYVRTFRTDPPDHHPPLPATWIVRPPTAGSREPLTVRFPEPLDYATLRNGIIVATEAGQVVAGDAVIVDAEQAWQWQPKEPWAAGRYRLRISPDLEDLAGNNPLRPFDRQVTEEPTPPAVLTVDVVVE